MKQKCRFCKRIMKTNKCKCGARLIKDNGFNVWKKVLSWIIFISFFSLVWAIPQITQISPTDNITTSNSSVEISYNLTIPEGEDLANITFHWDVGGSNEINFTPYDESLVLFMNFDNRSALGENDTHVNDLSKYGNNGTVYGGENISWTSNGKYGGAFNWTGNVSTITSSIKVTPNITNFPNMTLSVWYQSRNNTAINQIIWAGEDTFIFYIQNSLIKFAFSNLTATSGYTSSVTTLSNNQWYNIIITYDGNVGKAYLNGILDKTSNPLNLGSLKPYNSTTATYIGVSWTGKTNSLQGYLDDLIIFNRSLSTSEIKQLYYSQLTKYNSQNWSFYSNKSNLLDSTKINSTNPTYNNNYNLCSSNSTTEVCSTQKTITQTIPSKTLTANFTTSIGNVRNDFYGAVTNTFYFGNTTDDRIDVNNDGVLDAPINRTWHKEKFLSGKFGMTRFVIGTNTYYLNTSDISGVNLSYTSNFGDMIESVKFAYQNSIDVLVQIKRVPTWLADNSTGYCTEALQSCPPSNYTKYANIINDIYNRLTNNGEYTNTYYEWQNEPYKDGGTDWLSNISTYDNQTKANMYVASFNNISNELRLINPNIRFGGPSGYWGAPNMLITFLQNAINNSFVSYHSYTNDYELGRFKEELDMVVGNCSLANCSYIMQSEGNVWAVATKNSSDSSSISKYGMELASMYFDAHNYYAGNVSYLIWQWQEEYSWYNNLANYPESNKYALVSEPNLDNELTIAYNVTKNFAHLCPAGGTVYQSSPDDSTIKTVTCKKGQSYSVIVINTDTVSKNVTLSQYPKGIYNLIDGTTLNSELGIKDSYDISYIGNGVYGNNQNIYWNKQSMAISETKNESYVILRNDGNINQKVELYSLTNALIYNSNGSIYGNSNINSNDGNVNFTFSKGNSTYVLDNFNLTEGVSRANNPLWFSYSTGTSKHIASNLSTSTNTSIYFNANSCLIDSIIINGSTTGYFTTLFPSQFTCNNGIVNFTSYIENSTSSTIISINYHQVIGGGSGIGSNITGLGYNSTNQTYQNITQEITDNGGRCSFDSLNSVLQCIKDTIDMIFPTSSPAGFLFLVIIICVIIIFWKANLFKSLNK